VKKASISFSINNYHQAKEVIESSKILKFKPVLYIKYYLINGFGIDWMINLKNLLNREFSSNSFKFYVNARYDYGLSILLANNKIDFIKLNSNSIILKKISQICKKNRVILNPSFRIIDLSNIKNIHDKIIKIYSSR